MKKCSSYFRRNLDTTPLLWNGICEEQGKQIARTGGLSIMVDTVSHLQLGIWMDKGKHHSLVDVDANYNIVTLTKLCLLVIVE